MTTFAPAVVPAIPPRPPQVSLLTSAVRPSGETDPSSMTYPDGTQLALLPDDLKAELAARKGAAWTAGITYAPENHWQALDRDRCDFSTVDLPALAAPRDLALTTTAGGTLVAGNYEYQVTATNANGETTALAPVLITTGATGSITGTFAKTSDNAVYNIYGRASGSVGLLFNVGPFDADEPATFTDTGAASAGAAPPSSNTTGGPGAYTNLPIVTAIPFLVVVEDSCSSFGFEARDFKGRALRLLENATPRQLEYEWWTGAIAQAKGYPNRYLADSGVTDLTPGGGPPSVTRGQQILQDALQQSGFGGQGMLHVQAQTTPNMLAVRRVGPLMYDLFDNLVVPGVGYPGTGPANATPATGTAWMFATDLVMVRTEDEGTVFPDSFNEALDRGQAGQPNTIRFRAMKFAVAYADMSAQFACRVTLAT